MINGAYDLRVYCDVPVGDVEHENFGAEWSKCNGQFTGQSRAEAIRDARQHGWWLDWKSGRARCPACVKAGRKIPAGKDCT
jgi:hypothetical protein